MNRFRGVCSAVLVPLALTALSGTLAAQARGVGDKSADFAVKRDTGVQQNSGKVGAPEINPKLLGAGAILLVGGTLILLGRQRRRSATT